MTQFGAFRGFYRGQLALVLGSGTLVYLENVPDKTFVVTQHGVCIDEGRLSPRQAKRFTEAATGVREITRTTVNLHCLVQRATA